MKDITENEFGLKGISVSDDLGIKGAGETRTDDLGLKESGDSVSPLPADWADASAGGVMKRLFCRSLWSSNQNQRKQTKEVL